jgi:hypothetical protein
MLVICIAVALSVVMLSAQADQIVMQNGDQYYGKVLSLTTNALVLESEVLGNVTLPRTKVKLVNFGTNAPANALHSVPSTSTPIHMRPSGHTNGSSDWPAALRGLQTDTNLVRQVQAEYLGAATPEANLKFSQTLNGLANGTLTMNDLRGEARSAADQLRAFKRELGADAGDEIDGYLDILERFLRETESSAGVTAKPATNPSRPSATPASPKK